MQTREALTEASRNEELIDKIPEVDYLVPSNDHTAVVKETFDYVMANHVLEHVPNLIEWLRTVNRMLVDGGILFMALPDKESAFDRYRPDTPFSHILHGYYVGVTEISHEHLLEIEVSYDKEFVGERMEIVERLDPERLRACMDRTPHVGIHCHVFQCETFLDKVLRPILHMELVDFDIVGFHDSQSNHGKFTVVLKKGPPLGSWPRGTSSPRTTYTPLSIRSKPLGHPRTS